MKGTPPAPRDSHSCTTVGDNLFVFGGTDGRRPLNDLYMLDTCELFFLQYFVFSLSRKILSLLLCKIFDIPHLAQ